MTTIDRTNNQWLQELRSDDAVVQAQAIEDLKERLQRGIYYYLSRERSDLSGLSSHEHVQMAQDMAQDATLRVLDNLDSFRGDSLFTTWATRIAVRVAISDLRRARYRDFSLDNLTAEGDFLPSSASLISGERPAGPERAAEQENVIENIRKALKGVLTERQLQALVAVTIQEIPLEIVAEQMDTNRNALYKLIHDARKKLRQHLEGEGLSMNYIMNLFQENV